MCGVTGIIQFSPQLSSHEIDTATQVIHHRGPDDEGFLLWSPNQKPQVYAGKNSAKNTIDHFHYTILPATSQWKVALGHKRLSILDLSPLGHQPMVDHSTGVSLSFNGEVYNYKELREELFDLGHRFESQSDTEVILHAWVQWGEKSLHKFNGMFALLILDPREGGKLFAVRDRFGVKPLYWTKTQNYLGFASEIKQLKALSCFYSKPNLEIEFDFLAFGQLDHTSQTFDQNIQQLQGGWMMEVDLTTNAFITKKWYTIRELEWKGSDADAIYHYKELLTDSIKLRLRSDVPVGSCLSGGLDSSAIVCLMANLLKNEDSKGIKTITACYEEKKYDEWEYAHSVVEHTKAEGFRIFPSLNEVKNDLNKLLWHMDEPFGSTSQYSQWNVFKGAAQAGLKVMLDGQGADEQLAGYGGNDQPLYTGLLQQGKLKQLIQEVNSFKTLQGYWPKSQLINTAQIAFPWLSNLLPDKIKLSKVSHLPPWINHHRNGPLSELPRPKSLRQSLEQQLLYTSIPALLRYEDRNSMAFSIESRVPFLDYRLVEFTLSLPPHLIYKNGLRKVVLREAMKGIWPNLIDKRRDKMGFVTPEETWLKTEGKDWYLKILQEKNQKQVDKNKVIYYTNLMLNDKYPFDFSFWRLILTH